MSDLQTFTHNEHYKPINPHYSNFSITKTREKRALVHGKRYLQQQKRTNYCRRVDMNVNFKELGWDKWIIFPKVFNAHLCTGDCSLPLRMRKKILSTSYTLNGGSLKPASKLNKESSAIISTSATNHAQIMSILEYKHPEMNKDMTKCVSTKLRPLTVVFLDENGQIKTKQYEDMIVEECGCR